MNFPWYRCIDTQSLPLPLRNGASTHSCLCGASQLGDSLSPSPLSPVSLHNVSAGAASSSPLVR